MQGRWGVLRTLGGLAVLGVLAWRVGTEPFVAGLRAVDVSSVAAALLLVGGATVCTAQRWRVVARCAGVSLGLGEAVAAYYRSQFINSVLPGGMLGDLHRGLAHRTLRTVVWERVLGQSVQVAASLLVALVVWPADSRPSTGLLSGVAAAALVLTASLVGLLLARGVLDADALPTVLLTSVVAPACHAAVFVIAARAAGVTAGAATLVPIVLAVLVVAAVPLNVAGWGPREGAAAWAFAAVGLGAATGATVATTYGVLALVATLPGAALLVVHLRRSPAEWPHRERESVAAHG